MKREARLLLEKATDSLILSIEHFNRPSDRGRAPTVLILLDHSFEMLLKASILHRNGKIREKRDRETIGFDTCVRRALTDGALRFLNEDQALTLQTINGLRDAAFHHLGDISEEQLYLHAQSGVTLFRDLLKMVCGRDLVTELPARVMPIATRAPASIVTLFETESAEIAKLLKPGRRRRTEAYSRLRPLAILDATFRGEKTQPSDGELREKGTQLRDGRSWEEVFPGVAAVEVTAEGSGPNLCIRITKKEGIPICLVPEGTPGASVVGVKRVNELDFYNLGRDQLAEKVGLNGPRTTAAIEVLNLRADPEIYKEVVIGKARFKRYSQKAIERIREELQKQSAEDIWTRYQDARKAEKGRGR